MGEMGTFDKKQIVSRQMGQMLCSGKFLTKVVQEGHPVRQSWVTKAHGGVRIVKPSPSGSI